MAVTQQLARISSNRLSRCGNDTQELRDLISFEINPPEDWIDMDWAPSGLQAAVHRLGTREAAKMLDRLFGDAGAPLVDPAHPDGPDAFDVYSPITYNDPTEVSRLATALGALNPDPVGAAALESIEKENQIPRSGAAYYSSAFTEPHKFLDQAKSDNQAVVAWWD